jgi:hypothetical protein
MNGQNQTLGVNATHLDDLLAWGPHQVRGEEVASAKLTARDVGSPPAHPDS